MNLFVFHSYYFYLSLLINFSRDFFLLKIVFFEICRYLYIENKQYIDYHFNFQYIIINNI